MSSGGGGSTVVGYWYYMDVLLTFCHSADELVTIKGGDRVAWEGLITSNSDIVIQEPSLFGGEEREGGWVGTVKALFGGPTQVAPDELVSSVSAAGITGPVPGYRGLTSLFFTGGALNQIGFAWSAINPYFKPPEVLLRRYSKWYPTKARIANDANPIHIIQECLTNTTWGMGYPVNDLDDTMMRSAADTIFTEGFGISLPWNQTSSIEDFVLLILRHINGVLNQDRSTGKLFVTLVRDDYVFGDLPVLDKNNSVLESFSRAGAGEIVNEITLKYTSAENGETESITIQDLASIQNQGRVIAQEIELPGIRSPSLATRVAQRELQSRSRGLAKLTLRCTRAAYALYEGDAVVINAPDIGITGLVCRVLSMNIGDLESAEIIIEAVEDVFGLPSVSYVESPPIGWVDNSGTALPVVKQRAVEVPYYTMLKTTSSADRADYPADFGFGMLLAKTPQLSAINYDFKSSPDGSSYSSVGIGNWTPYCTLSAGIIWSDTVLPVSGKTLFTDVSAGDLIYVNDEIMEFVSITGDNITVRRGVLDTFPASHSAGDDVFVVKDGLAGYDTEIRVDGEDVFYKALTRSPQEVLNISSAPAASLTLNNRFARPYPPGNVKINGSYFPATLNTTGNLSVTWAHRDKTLQTVTPLSAWTAGNIGPEPGVTYNVRVYDVGNTVVQEFTGITGTGQTVLTGFATQLSHWTMDSITGVTIADENNTYPATNDGGSVVAGNLGDALAFAAAGSRITVPHNAAFNFGSSGDFAFSFWARWSNSSLGLIFGKFAAASPYNGPIMFCNNGAVGNVQFRTESGSGYELNSVTLGLNDNQWRHFAVVREGDQLRLYINGVLDNQKTTSSITNFSNTSSLFFMGRSEASQQVTGAIDDIQVFNTALTGGQVSSIYNTGAVPPGGGYSGDHRVEVESEKDGVKSNMFSHTFTLI